MKYGVINHSVKETRKQKEQLGFEVGGEGRGGEEGWTKFEKRGADYVGGLHKIEGLTNISICSLDVVAVPLLLPRNKYLCV